MKRKQKPLPATDAKLIALVKELAALDRKAETHRERYLKIRGKAEAAPNCPPLSDLKSWQRFMRKAGAAGERDAWNAAVKAQRPMARAISNMRARTIEGALAKLGLLLAADSEVPDDGLALWVYPAAFLPSVIDDLRRLARATKPTPIYDRDLRPLPADQADMIRAFRKLPTIRRQAVELLIRAEAEGVKLP